LVAGWVHAQVRQIVDESVLRLLSLDELDNLICKVIETDVWRECVKSVNEEQDICALVYDELISEQIRAFFSENFTDFKEEHLKQVRLKYGPKQNSGLNFNNLVASKASRNDSK